MSDSSNVDQPNVFGPEGISKSSTNQPSAESPAKSQTVTPHDNASQIAGETLDQVGASTGEFPTEEPPARVAASTGRSAFLVGAGILISRIVGLIRQRVF